MRIDNVCKIRKIIKAQNTSVLQYICRRLKADRYVKG